MVLFRFATSDYYSAPVDIIELNKGFMWSDKHTKGEAYRAQESVFLDFDIIQLSFQKDGDLTVIPVVSSPIDVVNDITSPVDMESDPAWWKILLGVIMLVLLLIILSPILPFIIQGLVWIICLPFKAIGALFKAISNTRRYGTTYHDKLKASNLFNVLSTYAQSYFIYVIESSLLVTNYSIRWDNILLSKGNFPVWNTDFFPKRYRADSKHAHILDFDILRLGKKAIEDNKKSPDRVNQSQYLGGYISKMPILPKKGYKKTEYIETPPFWISSIYSVSTLFRVLTQQQMLIFANIKFIYATAISWFLT